jgi:hypothetical protein
MKLIPVIGFALLVWLCWLRHYLYYGRGRWIGVPIPNNVVFMECGAAMREQKHTFSGGRSE